MESSANKTMQNDSPAGEFLQSEAWRSFQESVGRKTFHLSGEHFLANIIEHKLPIVGKYFYIPRGPVIKSELNSGVPELSSDFSGLIKLAKENKAGWIRIEPETEELLEKIKVWTSNVHNGHLMSRRISIIKAPHDMQPKEIFVIDITKSEEELLAEMKVKTRYNIKLAEKKGVTVNSEQRTVNSKNADEFLRLTAVMAKRQGITAHPENYYRKMLETIPGDNLKLYVAEFEGKIIAANLVIFYGETGTYLHGASDDEFRNVMAPYLLQWRQIQDAKKAGCVRYDFGGVASAISNFQFPISNQIKNSNDKNKSIPNTSWSGITKFKTGFSPKTLPTVFPGSYDIIISQKKYWLYRGMQKIKSLL